MQPILFKLVIRLKVIILRMRRATRGRKEMAALLNRLIGIGAGLAVTGAVINSTLYNGMQV